MRSIRHFVLAGSTGMPAWVARVLNAEANKLIVKPAYVQRFASLRAEPLASTPMETAAFIRAEHDKWDRVIREVGIKAE